jgi:hypothetical protein
MMKKACIVKSMYGISAQQSIPLHVSVIIQVIGPSISGSFNILNGHSYNIFSKFGNFDLLAIVLRLLAISKAIKRP